MLGTYEGWSNRETWAVALHVDNDQGLYAWKNELLRPFILRQDCVVSENGKRELVSNCADAIKSWVEEELFNHDSDCCILDSAEGRMMRDEIGSLWRIDWRELANHWLAD